MSEETVTPETEAPTPHGFSSGVAYSVGYHHGVHDALEKVNETMPEIAADIRYRSFVNGYFVAIVATLLIYYIFFRHSSE